MILLNMIFFYGQVILHCIYTIFSLSIHLLVGPKTDSTTCLLQVFLLYTALDSFKNMPRSRIPTSHCISMFHLFFMVVINIDQNPLLLTAHIPSLREAKVSDQGRNWIRSRGEVLLIGLFLIGWFSLLACTPRITCLGVTPPTVACLPSTIRQENASQTCPSDLMKGFFSWVSVFTGNFGLCEVDWN